MRYTCLKCGNQIELSADNLSADLSCVCGQKFSCPPVVNTGTHPNAQAAEKSRSRAFRAAGLTRNVGGFTLVLSLLGILFFPIAPLGVITGMYVLIAFRGPLGSYSGRKSAAYAVVLGCLAFFGEGYLALHWWQARKLQQNRLVQASVHDDLKALLRAQRLFRATRDTYGSFRDFRFTPPFGRYTFYLTPGDYITAKRKGVTILDPYPKDYQPQTSENGFTALATANLDDDPFVDVWQINDAGTIVHLQDDITDHIYPALLKPEPNDQEPNDSDEPAPQIPDENLAQEIKPDGSTSPPQAATDKQTPLQVTPSLTEALEDSVPKSEQILPTNPKTTKGHDSAKDPKTPPTPSTVADGMGSEHAPLPPGPEESPDTPEIEGEQNPEPHSANSTHHGDPVVPQPTEEPTWGDPSPADNNSPQTGD